MATEPPGQNQGSVEEAWYWRSGYGMVGVVLATEPPGQNQGSEEEAWHWRSGYGMVGVVLATNPPGSEPRQWRRGVALAQWLWYGWCRPGHGSEGLEQGGGGVTFLIFPHLLLD